MKFNTVTKKIIAQLFGISIVVLLALTILFPSVFYRIMRPHLCKQISGVAGSAALRQSYIWRNNSHLKNITENQELKRLISEYYDPEKRTGQTEAKIVSYLPLLENGKLNENAGYISFTNYFLLCTSEGDIFCGEQAKEAARIFEASDWYQSFDKSQKIKYHLPVIGEEETGRFFCVLDSFRAGDVNCIAVNMVGVGEVLEQLRELEEFQAEDYLIYSNGSVLYSNLGEASGLKVEECPNYLFEGKQYEVLEWENGADTVFSVLCTYKDEDFRLIINVPEELLLEPYQKAFGYFQLLLCGLTVFLLAAFGISLKGTISRIRKLERKMNGVRKGNYDVDTRAPGNDEISSLGNTFWTMLEKIKKDMKREEQMQYTLMVSAVDPHYIYNTLNTVTVLAGLGRTEEVVAVNNALIGTLKDRLKMKNYKTFDTVEAEREAMGQYMLIQSYLSYLSIAYSFQVSAEVQKELIPKNIIQPLVENAIKHGIACAEDGQGEGKKGEISVSVTQEGTDICIRIRDNGAGMDVETAEQFFRKKPEFQDDMAHIGVYNVRMRLNYLYQGNYKIAVESSPGEGTDILLYLPRQESPV